MVVPLSLAVSSSVTMLALGVALSRVAWPRTVYAVPADVHKACHYVWCNGNWDYPPRTPGHCCSCKNVEAKTEGGR